MSNFSWRPLSMVFLLICFSSLVFGIGVASKIIDVGTVGLVKKIKKGSDSFEYKSKQLPGKLRVELQKDTIYKSYRVKAMGEVKVGTEIMVLGVAQLAQSGVGPGIASIKAVAMGLFEAPPLDKSVSKVQGMKWFSGTLKKDGKSLMLGDRTLALGSARLILDVQASSKEKIKKKALVYVRGEFSKKAKGEKYSTVRAKQVFVLDRKLPQRQHILLLRLGVFQEKKKDGLDF